MAKIDHDAKTVSTVCQPDDEAKVRVALQEILDGNPGYTPVLVVEGEDGKETTYTSLTQSSRRRASPPEESLEEGSLEEESAEVGPDASADSA